MEKNWLGYFTEFEKRLFIVNKAETFITAIHSASEEANSPKTTPTRSDKNEKLSVKQIKSRKKSKSKSSTASSTSAKEVSDETETISTILSLNVENELRTEISSVKETVNSVKSLGHKGTDREITTSGGQNISQDSRDIATSGGQNFLRHTNVTNHDNAIYHAISLQHDREERRGLDLDTDSDNESQHSSVNKIFHITVFRDIR
ncbi:unnamed protein product [Mytilus coruscus]|uniref:Uncharacterized protein n=1 Tax=Mytilus coruscus TaxID=42192 RepID=A0A6J8AUB7_MYTCO|nr:unnamed protein product [Mytilus coruscus]